MGKNFSFQDLDFKKSSFSHRGKKVCVEVAINKEGVAVRDTKDPYKNILYFSKKEWAAFIAGVKAGEFNI
jgi:hypothetical protein